MCCHTVPTGPSLLYVLSLLDILDRAGEVFGCSFVCSSAIQFISHSHVTMSSLLCCLQTQAAWPFFGRPDNTCVLGCGKHFYVVPLQYYPKAVQQILYMKKETTLLGFPLGRKFLYIYTGEYPYPFKSSYTSQYDLCLASSNMFAL